MSHLKIKLNGGNPVVLCSNCDKILRPALEIEIKYCRLFVGKYCDDCNKKLFEELKNKSKE